VSAGVAWDDHVVGGDGLHGGRADDEVVTPPLRWRVAAQLSLLALPERYDPWSAERVRHRQGLLASLSAMPPFLGFVALVVLVGVRARLDTRLLGALLIAPAGLAIVVPALAPRQQRKLLTLLEHPPGLRRTGRGSRRLGWVCFAALAFNIANITLQSAVHGTPFNEIAVAALDGPGCRRPSGGELEIVRTALRPGSTASGLVVVRAGSTRAIAMHLAADGPIPPAFPTQGDSVVLLDPPGLFRFRAALVDDRSGPFLRPDLPELGSFTWSGLYRDPIPQARACSTAVRSDPTRVLRG
jgi:hypothetical protein